MVFSSFPVYLDHPNLHQLQQADGHQQGNTGLELPTVQPPPMQVGASPGSIRPGSMVDRARLAKIPLPEAGLKCPRCDSTNTKFCYFNNYNLSQPRHFCKTCRRYWTRGGALRSVPVGGGCRRNKRSKSSSNNNNNSSKSTGVSNVNTNTIASGTSTSASPSSCSTEIMNGRHHFPHEQPTQLTPLMAAFQNLNHHYGGFQPNLVSTHHGNGSALSSHHHEMGFQIGNSTNTNNTNNLPVPSGGGGSDHQWRLPSLAANTNLYPFQHGSDQGIHESSSGNNNNINGHHDEQGLNSTKQFLGTMENNSNQYWGGNAWTGGFSGLNSSSSASHLL